MILRKIGRSSFRRDGIEDVYAAKFLDNAPTGSKAFRFKLTEYARRFLLAPVKMKRRSAGRRQTVKLNHFRIADDSPVREDLSLGDGRFSLTRLAA